MRIQLYLGSEPVLLEIEENDYKPKLTMSNASHSVTAEIEDIYAIVDFLSDGELDNLTQQVEDLEDSKENLEDKINHLEADLRQRDRTISKLEEQILDLKKKIVEKDEWIETLSDMK